VFHAGWAERESQISQELQLGSVAGSRIQWLAGLYYLYGKASYEPFHFGGTAYSPVDTITFNSFTSTKSGAAFGQATTPLWDGAHLTAGVRYSVERRAIEGDTVIDFLSFTGIPQLTTGLTDAHTTFRKPTWRLALDQQITPDILGYVSYNRGFKSGIYNSVPPGGPDAQPVAPEILDAYEVGFKSDLFDGRLRLNVSGYYYNYSNLQVTVYTTTGASIQNGAKAEIYGGDFDLTGKIGSHLTLTAGANLMHSEFKSFPQAQFLIPQPASAGGGTLGVVGSAKGNELPYAPNSTFNVGADYSARLGNGKADLNINYGYTGRWFSGPDNLLKQDSYGLLNATASYTLPGDRIELGVWAHNLTDEKYYLFLAAAANPGGVEEGVVGAPRTYGISLGYKF
jgi:iron complex outermembrane receptor protein